jgi:pimeloyl-ACP methyl ester carboxylesterase
MKKTLYFIFISIILFHSEGNGQSWSELGGLNALNATSGPIYSICSDPSGNIYATGRFINDSSNLYVAQYNGSSWGSLGGPNGVGPGADIFSVCSDAQGNIYAAGFITNASGKYYVAKYNGSSWDELGGLNGLGANGSIVSICSDASGNIYAGGHFTYSYGVPYLAQYNGSSWGVLGGVNGLYTNNNILSVCSDTSGNIYAAGEFTNASGKEYVAQYNGSSWGEVGGLNGLGANGWILSICSDASGNIYAAGGFTNASGKYYVAKYNGSSWVELGGLNGLGANGGILSICSDASGNIYAAGQFTNTSGKYYVARYNGSSWVELGGLNGLGASLSILSICSDASGNIYAAGNFTNASGKYYVAKYGNTNAINNLVNPIITISSGALNQGQSLTIQGSNFTTNNIANLIVNGPNSYQNTWSVSTSGIGKFTYNYPTDSTMPIGHYTLNAVDSATGVYAPVKSLILNSSQFSNSYLKVIAPFSGDTLYVNDTSQITWHDKMVLGSQYPISGAHRSYYYDIDYSNDNGSTWQTYTSLQGSAYINAVKTFHVPFAFISPGSVYYVRVVDHYKPSNRDSTGAIIVLGSSGSGNIKAQLYWDFSYNNQNNGLYGVAADGTARLYAVISKIDTTIGGNIASVSVDISDDWNNNTATLGKVMAATQVSSYSDEANTANSLTATQNSEAFSRFWFWYVAPNDFVGNNPSDPVAAYRYVTAHFQIHYSSGNTDTISKKIKIVRPPLCFVHGLASDPSTWLTFSSNGSGSQLDFLNDPRFYTTEAIQIDQTQSFNVNAQFITLGFSNTNSLIFQNSLQGVIKNLRDQGYAANRCDYIGHSMGGSILRYALDNYSDYFYRTGNAANRDYKNYEQGYVNKVITLCTPHNGSPWADILNRYVGQLSYVQRAAIQTDYNYFPNSLPFSFITQDQYGLFNVPTFKVVDAVTDLQIDSTLGGVKFQAENIRMHLISAGIFPGVNYNSSNYMIPQQVINIVDVVAQDVDFLNDFADATIANEQDQQVVSDLIQIGNSSTNPVQTALQYLERMADFYNIAVFIPSSDLVVSKSSALEDNPVTAPNVSVFDNYIGHAFINPILNDIDAGNEVNYLFNAPISSNNFGPVAGSSYFMPHIPFGNARSLNIVSSVWDTTVLKIMNPISGANLATDSIIDIKINLPDTANLISLKVRFQNKTYKIKPAPGITDLNTQVNSNILDSSYIYAQAFYKFADSSIFYYDSVLVNVTTTSNLISFAAQQQIIYLNINQEKFPDYVSGYQDFATSMGNFSKYITANVGNNSIATFDPVHKGFIGVTTGETYALVSYKGLTDTIYLVVGENPLDSVSTGIKPISSEISNPNELQLVCYPNPFNQFLNINFDIAVSGDASLKIYDLLGREVANLLQGNRDQGQYQTAFDSSTLPNGIYLCELRNGLMSATRKIVLVHNK